MKKIKITKKLSLKKTTIANFNRSDMYKIKAASLIVACTDSCSAIVACCQPTTQEAEQKLKGDD